MTTRNRATDAVDSSGRTNDNAVEAMTAAAFRLAKVEGLRRAIANGTYRVHAEELAETLLKKAAAAGTDFDETK